MTICDYYEHDEYALVKFVVKVLSFQSVNQRDICMPMTIGVSTRGEGGASAPPRRTTSYLGGKDFLKDMPFLCKNGQNLGFIFNILNV